MAGAGFSNSEAGFTDNRESKENDITFQTSFIGNPLYDPKGLVVSTATDSTHTSYTAQLRAGLVMAKVTSSGLWTAYDPTANDGSQWAAGILARELFMTDPSTGSPTNRLGQILISANVKAAGSLLYGLDQAARDRLKKQGFVFDDCTTTSNSFQGADTRKVTATATLTAADHGKLIEVVSAGAVVLTLPAIANGLVIDIVNLADQNLTVTSAEGTNVVGVNNLSATSVAFTTSSNKIGARLRLQAVTLNGASTLKWLATFGSAATATLS